MSRLIAVGDIHGEITKLEQLIELIDPSEGDRLVYLGDYIDRGENSRAVIEYLIEQKRRRPQDKHLLGNHDWMYFAAKEDQQWFMTWFMNGGSKTDKDYGGEFPVEHEEFLRTLLPFYREGNFIFVHAGLNPYRSLQKQVWEMETSSESIPLEDHVLWQRGHLMADLIPWERGLTLVCGHTPQPEPIIREKLICIDTGACSKKPELGKLSAIDVRSKYVYQADGQMKEAA